MKTIVSAIYMATQKIVITTPYFVPDEPLLGALTTAARRGVEVTLILPEKVDSLMVRYASRAYYPMLLAAGVKIALFKGGLLHARTMTIDDDFTLFGTVEYGHAQLFPQSGNQPGDFTIRASRSKSVICSRAICKTVNTSPVKDWQKRANGGAWWENTVLG